MARRAIRRPISTHVAGYIRVSTEEQAVSGLGLEAQRHAIRQACEHRGWTLTLYEDAGASGSTLANRPGLAEALEAVESGEACALVVAKLDRLSRSLLDFAGLMEQSRRQEWSLIALDLGVDTSTPQGELMAAVLATFAQFERRLISQRTKAALQAKAAQGIRLGRPRTVPTTTVERIRALRADGLTWQAVADALNAESVPTGQKGSWHAGSAYRVFSSRASTQTLVRT